ncbi:unnamed protein product [Lymnaea stagnalis]|uniref:L-dopachrome isomerase n=1 Tax=Lymnaea stagnalis TaxID=6523 RepID=A0AAV2IHA5_LYMST
MPIIKVETNIEASRFPTNFHVHFTALGSELLQKPQKVIWVVLEADKQLTMGGTNAPTAVVTVECIGRLKPELNLAFGTKIEEYFKEFLAIPRDRIVTRFVSVPALFCQYDGKLHDIGVQYDQDL